MKFALNIVALALLAKSFVVHAVECDDNDPFAGECLDPGMACNENPSGCCEGGCFGFNFFKKCQDPPECLETFHDCLGVGDIECCGNLECTKTSSDLYECRPPSANTRSTELPDGTTGVEPVPEDEPEDEDDEGKNYETTKDDRPLEYNVACVTGDPHMDTFDGMLWNCQGHGEHIILRSTKTQREVQGRFVPIRGGKVSITRALVIQDEGNTPKVQVQVPVNPDLGFTNTLGSSGCKVQVLVNDVVINPWEGSGNDAVEIKITNSIEIRYKESGMFVTIQMGGGSRCVLNSCYYIPTSDDTLYGILGSPDGDVTNDWATRDGQASVTLPDKKGVKGQEAYDYCTTHWCMSEEKDSLFAYNEHGVTFDTFMGCDHEFGSVGMEEIIAKADTEKIRACTQNDVLDDACLTDAVLEGLDMALDGAGVRKRTKKTCNKSGGKCSEDSDCCNRFKCADEGFLGGSCIPVDAAEPECLGYLQKCSDKNPCCEDMQCVTKRNGKSFCMPIMECERKNSLCATDDECCGRMSCVGPADEKRCKDIGSGDSKCLPKGEACGFGINCCNGSTCVDDPDAGLQCVELPRCWDQEDKPCNQRKGMPPCCEGYTCRNSFGRQLCKKNPKCAVEFAQCDQVECCTDGKELMCKEFTNGKGQKSSRCVDAQKEKRAQERKEWKKAQEEHQEKLAKEKKHGKY